MTVIRFAPSSTGRLHIGNIKSFINLWLISFKNLTKFFLRIDDTDIKNYKLIYIKDIIYNINYFNLILAKIIIFQSKKFYRYIELSQFMIKKKLIFVSYENVNKYKFVKIYKNLNFEKFIKLKNFKYNKIEIFKNCVLKIFKYKTNLYYNIDNYILVNNIIIKSNGIPVYNFSSVIDDIDMNISLIVRGIDHLSNLNNQLIIFKLFKKVVCKIHHTPILLNKTGNKISKRNFANYNFYNIKSSYFKESIIFYLSNNITNIKNNKNLFTLSEILNNKYFKNFYLKLEEIKLIQINKFYFKIFNNKYIKNILKDYIFKKYFIKKKLILKFNFINYTQFLSEKLNSKIFIKIYKNNFINFNKFIKIIDKNIIKIFYFQFKNFDYKILIKSKLYYKLLNLFIINKINFPFIIKYTRFYKRFFVIKKNLLLIKNLLYIVPFV